MRKLQSKEWTTFSGLLLRGNIMLIIVEDNFGKPLNGATIVFQQGDEILATVVSNVGRGSIELPDPAQATLVKVTYGEATSEANIAAGQTSHTFKLNVGTPPPVDVPKWFAKAGFASLIFVMMFLMVIVFFSSKVQDDRFSRMAFSSLLGFSCAAAALFFGGSAAAEGRLPLPGGLSPLRFSIGSGVAVFVIVTLLSFYMLRAQDNKETSVKAAVLDQCLYFQKGATDFLRLDDKYAAKQMTYVNSILSEGLNIGIMVIPETAGSMAIEQALTEARSSNIVKYLRSKGISAEKIVRSGQGETPIISDRDAQPFVSSPAPSEITNVAEGARCTGLLLARSAS